MNPVHALRPYLDHIAGLFPGVEARFAPARVKGTGTGRLLIADAELELRLRGRAARLQVEAKRTHLATAVARALVGALGADAHRWILFAPHIGRPLGRFLAEHGLNYLDLRGNCHLHAGDVLTAHVEGRPGAKGADRPKGVRAAGVKALFAVLADDTLLAAPGRDIARAAGTTHPTALGAVRRLVAARAVAADGDGRRWMPGGRRVGLEQWIEEYATVLRPALVIGTYRTPDLAPPDLDMRVAAMLADGERLRLGGAAAAFRVAPHHRGERTVLHVDGNTAPVLRALRAVADPHGAVELLGMPGPLAARGLTPDTVHPLLVYAEMLHAADDRTLEAAQRFREHALGEWAS